MRPIRLWTTGADFLVQAPNGVAHFNDDHTAGGFNAAMTRPGSANLIVRPQITR